MGVDRDPEAKGVDAPGLVTEAGELDRLLEERRAMIPELWRLTLGEPVPPVRLGIETEPTRSQGVADRAPRLKGRSREAGCRFVRLGKGVWHSPNPGRWFAVDGEIRSRHTANGVFEQAGPPKAF